MTDHPPSPERLQRLLAKSQRRRAELEHLIDTGQSFQRKVLADVEKARAQLQVVNEQLKQEKHRTDQLLLSIMPASVAEELKQTGGVVPKRAERATVMFADFVSFTNHAEALDPLVLVRILDQYYSEFDRIMTRNHVEKVKTIGDAYMCVGGLDDDPMSAARMVHAAHEILQYVQSVRPYGVTDHTSNWQIRIGINTGPVSTGVIGYDRLSFDVWGDTVNTAARLVATCPHNDLLLAQSTFDMLPDQAAFAPSGVVPVKGRGPVSTYRSTQK